MPTLVSSSARRDINNASGTTLARGAALSVSDKDLVLAICHHEGAATTITVSGFSPLTKASHGSGIHSQIFYKIQSGAGSVTPTMTLAAGRVARRIDTIAFSPASGKVFTFQSGSDKTLASSVTAVAEVTLADIAAAAPGVCVLDLVETFGCGFDNTDTPDPFTDAGIADADQAPLMYLLAGSPTTITPAMRCHTGSGEFTAVAAFFGEDDEATGVTATPSGSEGTSESGTPSVQFAPGVIWKIRW